MQCAIKVSPRGKHGRGQAAVGQYSVSHSSAASPMVGTRGARRIPMEVIMAPTNISL